MATIIRGGGGGKKTKNTKLADTQAENVKEDVLFVDFNGELAQGTMPNRGAVSQTIAPGGQYIVPLGYHDGTGVVTASPADVNMTAFSMWLGVNVWQRWSGELQTDDVNKKVRITAYSFGDCNAQLQGYNGSSWSTLKSGGGTQSWYGNGYISYRVYTSGGYSKNNGTVGAMACGV